MNEAQPFSVEPSKPETKNYLMKLFTYLTLFFLTIAGCAQTPETEPQDSPEEYSLTKLTATVMSVSDSDVSGTVTFSQAEEGVMVQGEFEGLEPGNHGFHIHEFGDCSADDGTSAGGHFSPADNEHGAPTDGSRHMGDLGNLEANDEGVATVEYIDSTIDLKKILGRGIIIHAGEDDLESQPTGDAGGRVACGVIGVAQTE